MAEQVTLVVMEATGDYWKPFYCPLEAAPFEVLLVNARHVKNLPGAQNGCVRCRLAGSARCARAGPWLVRAARTDPSAPGSDQDPDHRGPGAGQGRSSGWRSCWRTPASS